MATMCAVEGCGGKLKNADHLLCRKHWKQDQEGTLVWPGGRAGVLASNVDDDGVGSTMLSSTKLGEIFDLHATSVNLILQELGWIERYVKGWKATLQGTQLGAEVRESKQRGVPYVVWPPTITRHPVLLANIKESMGELEEVGPPSSVMANVSEQSAPSVGFRDRFPGTFRATDGHVVRSRAEVMIDTWLYMQKIVHAVERRLPIEEEAYCDFYVPEGKVYIEYWGLENDPHYAMRMEAKKLIYSRNGLNLVELRDEDIKALDDVLPRKLLKYGVDCT